MQIAVSERLVHAWDLALATGQALDDDVEVIAEALLGSADFVAVNDEVRRNTPAPMGPQVATDADAAAIARLVAFLGRDPQWACG